MARKIATADSFDEHIVDTNVSEEMRASYLEYAYSVIYSRALPDARDGLKPVQRRILYTMSDMGLRPDKGHVKSARVVGEVMGRLHPHGDGSIYDALVRLVQPWAMRLPYVDGHGNFGSPDDMPAAMRYTECRMAPAALAMVGSIAEETVDFRPNYDGRELEPIVLPTVLPNLLINGTTGIAVGMATNIAPHNVIETVQAAKYLLNYPKAKLDDLMKFIPGPDLPTGGMIIGLDGVRDAYAAGKGSFKMRATTRIESVTPRRKGIVVTELPYNVGPEKVMDRIKTLVQAKKLQGIADLKNLTDRNKGLQLVIEIKSGFNPEAVLAQLFKLTPLEESFSINAVALVDGQPRTLGLVEMLQVFVDHRRDVVTRRSQFRLRKAQDRLHLVDGLLVAILSIDEVIQVIRSSEDTGQARERLMSVFDLSELQANHILDLRLARLTKFSRIELEAEQDELKQTIEGLTLILADDKELRRVIGAELDEAAKNHGEPRKTLLLESVDDEVVLAPNLEVTDDPVWVMLSTTGLLARTPNRDPFEASSKRTKHDALLSVVPATARGEVGLLTTTGEVHKIDVLELPVVAGSTSASLKGGAPVTSFKNIRGKAVSLLAFGDDAPNLVVGTARGVVKHCKNEYLSKASWEIIALSDGDYLVGAAPVLTGTEELVFITDDAQLLRFGLPSVRAQGRSGSGIAGIRLADGAQAMFFGAVTDPSTAEVLTVSGSSTALPGTQAGSVKRTAFESFPGKGRATAGVRCHRFSKGHDQLIFAWAGQGPVVAAATSGSAVDLPEVDSKRDGSGSGGSQPIAGAASPAFRLT